MDLNGLLSYAVRLGASDVHLKFGRPPIVRHDGHLRTLDDVPPLDEATLLWILEQVAAGSPERLDRFRGHGDLDVAYQAPGLPRFRVNGYRPSGFQGILWSNSWCVIHQEFQDSGPVICNRIYVPNGENGVPTFYTFPYTGNLTDGQAYDDTATSDYFEISPGKVSS